MTGLKAFFFIFLMMPFGHSLMIIMNRWLGEQVGWGAFGLFLIGIALLAITRWTRSTAWQSFLWAFAEVLLWTGAVEYGLLYAATVLGIVEVNGTAGEYRLMMHTWSFLLLLLLYLVVHESVRCSVFIWMRKKFHLTRSVHITGTVTNYGPRTAFEMASILWFFYVIVLWNVVEIMAKWRMFEEPWITLQPSIMVAICVSFAIGVAIVMRDLIRPKQRSSTKSNAGR